MNWERVCGSAVDRLPGFPGRGGGERERRGGREREAVSSREEEERDCQEEVERKRLYQEERYLFIQVRLRRASKRPKTLGHVLVAAGHSALLLLFLFLPAITLHLPWEDLECSGRKSEDWKLYSTLNKWGWLAYDGDTKGQTQKAEVWGYR